VAVKLLREDFALAQGKRRAELTADRAWRCVPAYRQFLAAKGLASARGPFESLPVMEKDNYVRAFPTDQRCVGGDFLQAGVMIDESSGSTGTPYNWVRGKQERALLCREVASALAWRYGTGRRIAINAFSMGAWATGVNMGESLGLYTVVKSTGPDLEKVLHTLEFFGPKVGYFICGYPPFLKLVLDSMLQRGFPVEQYELHGIVGGEGMTEGFRRYVLRHFKTCYSGYGASDLNLGIGIETPEAVHVRGLLNDHADVRAALLPGDHRVPMVFQYNPFRYYLETNERDELIVTMNHSRVLSPRVRYNIKDEALLIRRTDLLTKLAAAGHPIPRQGSHSLDLPYFLLFGRRDQTISIMGANIYPEDMERVLYAIPEVALGMASFTMSVEEKADGNVFPRICIEWQTGSRPTIQPAELAQRIVNDLSALNSDFRNARAEYAGALDLSVELHPFGEGPFANRGRRIKNRYVT
jgi:phenylacetate-CoA ligase